MAPRRRTPFRRFIDRTFFTLLAIVVLAYPVDWLFWRMLSLAGHGMGTALVTQTTAATLKGNHFEVYSQQTATVPCSYSFLPEAGQGPCWWLHRHPEIVTQY